MITLPGLLILFGVPALSFFLMEESILRTVIVIVAVVLGIGLSWLWWSIFITKWRIWAFNSTNLEDWPDLKYLAIEHKLIWHDGAIFEKTEIRNRKEKERIHQFASQTAELEAADNQILDMVSAESVVYKKKKKGWIFLYTVALLLLSALLMNVYYRHYLLSLIFILFFFLFGGMEFIKFLFNEKFHLSISETGIEIAAGNTEMIPWPSVEYVRLGYDKSFMEIKLKESKIRRVEFWKYDIGDYRTFTRHLTLYTNRYIRKIENENSSNLWTIWLN